MVADSFKLTIHIVSSLDGIIAKKDNSTSWFETADRYEKGESLTDEQTAAFLAAIDCYVMGANTYEHAIELSKTYGWAYGEKPVIVLTHRNLPVARPNITLYAGEPGRLVDEELKTKYNQVWLVGGALLSQTFMQLKLADELRISIVPIILGDGLKFFDSIRQDRALRLINTTAYKNGMVELVYEIKK